MPATRAAVSGLPGYVAGSRAQSALTAALASGHLAAAALDHFEGENIAVDHPLCGMPNVVLTPHIASSTRATRAAMARLAIDNLRAGLRGEVPPSLLNREVLQNRRV